MKNLFGKLLVGVTGCAMALSINAFAAEIGDLTATVADKTTGAVTVSGTITGDADSYEATILVVEQGRSLATVTDDQIRYIDQETAQSGAFSYSFKLETGKVYDVYCGGTDVTSVANGSLDLTSSETTKFKIVGSISVSNGDYSNATVAAKVGEETVATVNTDASGAYTLEVEAGTYDIVVGAPGYLYKTYKSKTVAADETLSTEPVVLFAGDVNSDDSITASDLVAVLNNVGVVITDENKAQYGMYNLNADTNVTIADVTVVLANVGLSADTAYGD